MSYIAVTMNHIRAIKAWLDTHGGVANLNVQDFELEVKARNRYFRLYPQFLAVVNKRPCYVPTLTPEVTGFIGWLPYRPLRWALSTDKRLFKECLRKAGVSTPAMWDDVSAATSDYVLKSSTGSFGFELDGPFSHAQAVPSGDPPAPVPLGTGTQYVEQFVTGRNLKVWFWGATPFHAHLHDYPEVEGDGTSTVTELIQRRFETVGLSVDTYPEMEAIRAALRYQGVDLDDVIAPAKRVWIDFRYGRRFAAEEKTEAADNAMPLLSSAVVQQFETAGAVLAKTLADELPSPVLYSLDAVLDVEGKVWWLEMNSNPTFPPTGYPHLLSTLFGTPVARSAGANDTPAATPISNEARASHIPEGIAA